MARIRTVKPEFWTSEQVADCSPTARLLFIGMWNFCDDQGVHPASAKRLKMEVFPADSFTVEQIEAWVDELREAGLLTEYTSEGNEYWAVTGWKHQRIEKPQSKYPAPPERQIDNQSQTAQRQIADRSPQEGKGREGNGEESKGVERRDVASLVSSIAQNKKPPSAGTNFSTAQERRARWQQKIMEELRRTLPDKRAEEIIFAYTKGERWAIDEFERVDKRIKSLRGREVA